MGSTFGYASLSASEGRKVRGSPSEERGGNGTRHSFPALPALCSPCQINLAVSFTCLALVAKENDTRIHQRYEFRKRKNLEKSRNQPRAAAVGTDVLGPASRCCGAEKLCWAPKGEGWLLNCRHCFCNFASRRGTCLHKASFLQGYFQGKGELLWFSSDERSGQGSRRVQVLVPP